MNICPNCGYSHADKDFAPELIPLPLPRREREVVLRLSQAQGRLVHRDRIIDFMYGDEEDGGPEDAMSVLQTHICRVRPKIIPHGWTIQAERHRGYRLVRMS